MSSDVVNYRIRGNTSPELGEVSTGAWPLFSGYADKSKSPLGKNGRLLDASGSVFSLPTFRGLEFQAVRIAEIDFVSKGASDFF